MDACLAVHSREVKSSTIMCQSVCSQSNISKWKGESELSTKDQHPKQCASKTDPRSIALFAEHHLRWLRSMCSAWFFLSEWFPSHHCVWFVDLTCEVGSFKYKYRVCGIIEHPWIMWRFSGHQKTVLSSILKETDIAAQRESQHLKTGFFVCKIAKTMGFLKDTLSPLLISNLKVVDGGSVTQPPRRIHKCPYWCNHSVGLRKEMRVTAPGITNA